jgi:arginyl-tRNA synthetase
MQLIETMRARMGTALRGWVEQPEKHARLMAAAKNPEHGDYQGNMVMGLAKTLGQAPEEVASRIRDHLAKDPMFSSVEVAGKGFINIRLADQWIAEQVQSMTRSDRLGVQPTKEPKCIVLDYSSPNVAKPMHVGHVRSTVIGDSIARTLRYLGHRVVTDNHLGDWGTQFGMIIYGYKHFRDDKAYEQSPVAELSRLYRLVHEAIEYEDLKESLPVKKKQLAEAQARYQAMWDGKSPDPADKKLFQAYQQQARDIDKFAEQLEPSVEKFQRLQSDKAFCHLVASHPGMNSRVLAETAKLHEGDPENRKLWDQFLPPCLEEIHKVYRRLGVQFDMELGESYYHPHLEEVVEKLLEDGKATVSDGAVCVFLKDFAAPMIIRKQDGAFLYATTDLATADYRLKQFQPDEVLYVVDHRQRDHFKMLFQVIRDIYGDQCQWRHLSFGTVQGPDGKPIKTRSGSVIGLEWLLDEAVGQARKILEDPERLEKMEAPLNRQEMDHIAQVVGLGAVKYADLMHNRESDYKFDIEKMIQFEGNTATALQYSYARIQSILEKSGITPRSSIRDFSIVLGAPIERELGLHLLRFHDVLELSMEEYFPNLIASYLFDLSKLFASFYDRCSVLKEENQELRKSRLHLVECVGMVLKQGLALLGIDVVQQM